jgi:hypothetical protein
VPRHPAEAPADLPVDLSTVHERDCAPCEAAREVVREMRPQFDPLDNWDEVEIAPGITCADYLLALIAGVLHRRGATA